MTTSKPMTVSKIDDARFDAVWKNMKHGHKTVPAPPPPPPPPPPRGPGPLTLGYVRVSTERQAAEGQSLDAQESALRAYAAQKGLGTIQVFVEGGVSAKTPFADRPAGREVIARLRAGDSLLMTKLDRGFRNLVDFLQWFDRWQVAGIHLHIIDFSGLSIDPRSATGRLFVHMMAAVAQWEREANGERVRAAFAEKRAKGLLPNGHPPRGFKVARDHKGQQFVVPNPYARELMGQMVAWNDAGWSQRAILAHLLKHDVKLPSRLCKGWNTHMVHFYLRDERRLQAAEKAAAKAIKTPTPTPTQEETHA
jgi:DNA invertase Pin-like site-specific DNA recombinase